MCYNKKAHKTKLQNGGISMDNVEHRVKSMLDSYEVIVAIFTEKEHLFDSMQAKKVCRNYKLEILNCKHPTLFRESCGRYSKAYVFGVTDYMKREEQYMGQFLNACQSELLTELIGIKARDLY